MIEQVFYPKQKVIETISSLNRHILKDFIESKQQFESTHIQNHQISISLKTWKQKFDQTVDEGLKQMKQYWSQNHPGEEFSSSVLVKQLSKIYAYDQQYIETIKCLNSTTDMIKDYIRIKAIKDPTTAVLEKHFGSSQTLLMGSARSIDM